MSHTRPFNTIGLIGKPNHSGATQTLTSLYQFLHQRQHQIVVDQRVAEDLPAAMAADMTVAPLVELGKRCDLAIVVGGDGNMLGAARVLARHGVPMIGVNRGNLGFLTDISPVDFETPLEQVLKGQFRTEERFLLDVEIERHERSQSSNSAVNEAVLHSTKVAQMIEFEIWLDGEFVSSQRSDGLIVATPTGSTAYSLSGGGPILSPCLDAITLVPMFPHTLTSRPLVVDANARLQLVLAGDIADDRQITCDGQVTLAAQVGDRINISKSAERLQLIHPESYSYFDVLRGKLSWGSKLF